MEGSLKQNVILVHATFVKASCKVTIAVIVIVGNGESSDGRRTSFLGPSTSIASGQGIETSGKRMCLR